jgi:exosortase/archaeosortase family protein
VQIPKITKDLDALPMLFLFFIAIFLYSIKDELNKIKEIKWKIVDAVIFITIFLVIQYVSAHPLNVLFKFRSELGPGTNGLLFYLINLINIVSALILFPAVFNLNFAVKFYKKHEWAILLNLAIFLLAAVFTYFLYQNWTIFSETASAAVVKILPNSSYAVDSALKNHIITYKTFSADIGPPCSGTTSLSLFLFVFAALIVNNYKKFNLDRTAIFMAVGSAGMFLINILRLAILIWIGGNISGEIALNLFHNDLGWIFYLVYLLIALKMFFIFATKRKTYN